MVNAVVIVPSRGRVDNCLRLLDAFIDTASCDLVFAIDEDEVELYKELYDAVVTCDGISVVAAPRLGMAGTLNLWASKIANDTNYHHYDYIGFMGDDHLPITPNWDAELVDAIGSQAGVSYGNDLLQGENLPTSVMLSADIVRTLGWMSPPELKHLFMDNFWKALGEQLGNLTYLPETIIEHLHYTNGKAAHDERYQAVNTPQMHNHDQQAFMDYMANCMQQDVERIKCES